MSSADWDVLEQELLQAHADEDTFRLSHLYAQAARLFYDRQDIDRACFYDTHAYVFGLCSGHPNTAEILARLRQHGRED